MKIFNFPSHFFVLFACKKNYCVVILFMVYTTYSHAQIITLPQAIQVAVQNNYDILISKNEGSIGTLNNTWGNAGALPTINSTVNKSFGSNSIQQELTNGTSIKRDGAAVNNLNASVLASWRFFDGYKMFATKKRLETLEKIGQTNFTKQVNETIYNTIVAYYTIVQLQQQAIAIQQAIQLNEERLKIADTKFKIGSAAKTDVLQAQVDLNEQQAILISTENSIANAKINFNTVLAKVANSKVNITDTFKINAPIQIETLQQKIALQNPDVLLANSNLTVLLQTKKEINAQRLPTATLSSNYNFARNKSEAGFTLLNQNYGPTAAIGLAIPIFNGGNIKQQLKVAEIHISNQQIAINQIKNDLQAALNTAINNYNNGNTLAIMEQKNLLLIAENNMINMERFKQLSITSIELRQGQLNYTAAKTRLLNAQYQSTIALAQIQLLCGEIQ
jgi:outer membrane protein